MPLGKANSSSVFCTWTTAWCESFQVHFQNQYTTKTMLSSYVDHFFWCPIRTVALQYDQKIASLPLKNLIEIGDITNTRVNLEE